jgi:hypothetical protein
MINKVSSQLSAYPDYLRSNMGLDFSYRYHNDPEYRNEKWKEILRWVYLRFGRYGCGNNSPADSYSATTLGSVHLISWLFGAGVLYFDNLFPDTYGYPLENISNLNDFNINIPVFRERLAILKNKLIGLIARFGREKVSIPFYSSEIDGVKDLDNTHCPFTIAYRLFGNRLLTDMLVNPDEAKTILFRTLDIIYFLSQEFRTIYGMSKPSRVLMSACASTFLGSEQWEEFVMPLISDYCGDRETFFHSCGPSNHLLGSFGKLAGKTHIIRFDCREQSGIDIRTAAAAMPEAVISMMMDVPKCLTRTTTELKEAVTRAVEDSGINGINLILMLPDEAKDETVEAFYEQCHALGATNNDGFRFV